MISAKKKGRIRKKNCIKSKFLEPNEERTPNRKRCLHNYSGSTDVVSNQHTSSCRMDFLSFWVLKNRKKETNSVVMQTLELTLTIHPHHTWVFVSFPPYAPVQHAYLCWSFSGSLDSVYSAGPAVQTETTSGSFF